MGLGVLFLAFTEYMKPHCLLGEFYYSLSIKIPRVECHEREFCESLKMKHGLPIRNQDIGNPKLLDTTQRDDKISP